MTDPQPSRRSVLDLAIKGGLAAGACAMAAPAFAYLLPAGSRGPRETLVSAGPADTFEPSTARMIQGEGKPVIVVATEGKKFRAFSAICTHLGCIVKWDAASRKILCPCHAGVFGPDGQVISGPPPRPLPPYEVIQVGNELKVKV